MADYGSSTDLGYLIQSISDSVSSNLKSYALEVSTTWINSQVPGISFVSVPDLIEKAATYYAYVFILRNLYDTDSEEGAMVKWFEAQANDLVAKYISQNPSVEDYDSPYSSSLTPTERYMDRNLRTVDDTNEPDENNVPEEWESERE